jgi:nucleotide-binding universal stress UspA family protein
MLPAWRKIVVPAIGAPYSERAIQAACRLAEGVAGADVRLIYVMEVPRALAMATPLPGEEALAEQFLAQGREQAQSFDVPIVVDVIRGRIAIDTLIRYLTQHEIDLLVLGSRADEVRGLPVSITQEIFSRAPCPVILDHIGAETEPASAA